MAYLVSGYRTAGYASYMNARRWTITGVCIWTLTGLSYRMQE